MTKPKTEPAQRDIRTKLLAGPAIPNGGLEARAPVCRSGTLGDIGHRPSDSVCA